MTTGLGVLQDEPYRGAILATRSARNISPPGWMDIVLVRFPQAEELHGKLLQREAAKRLLDWWHDTGADQAKLPPPFTAVKPVRGRGHDR